MRNFIDLVEGAPSHYDDLLRASRLLGEVDKLLYNKVRLLPKEDPLHAVLDSVYDAHEKLEVLIKQEEQKEEARRKELEDEDRRLFPDEYDN
jgi:hypothetical protein